MEELVDARNGTKYSEIQHSSYYNFPIDINTNFKTFFFSFILSPQLKIVKLTGLYIPSSQLGTTVPSLKESYLLLSFQVVHVTQLQ